MLPLIKNLADTLDAEGVAYCHWKSNAFVADAAAGDDDLDLLIAHRGSQAFLTALDRLGFKEVLTPARSRSIPGVLDYYGTDETRPGLVHVHAHFKLVVGQDRTKNYHLPFEDAYLASSSKGEWLRIPAPAFEYALFVIRMTLKYSTWNAVLTRRDRLTERDSKDLAYLLERVSRDRVDEVLSEHLPVVAPGLFEACVRSLNPGCPVLERVITAHRLHLALRGFARRHRIVDAWLQIGRRAMMSARLRLLRRPYTKRAKGGGLLVAFVGGDGSGKTTVIDGLAEWLSQPFAVHRVHMGKPAWSITTVLVRGFLKAGRILRLWPFSNVPLEASEEGTPIAFPGYPALVRAVCTARDRYLTFVRSRRRADRGGIVLCDRYPLPKTLAVDGPQIDWMARSVRSNRSIDLLRRLEARYYRAISCPDLLLVLKVAPDVAVERKTTEDPAYVRARTRALWEKDWGRLGARVIDATRTKDEVLRQARAEIWAHL